MFLTGLPKWRLEWCADAYVLTCFSLFAFLKPGVSTFSFWQWLTLKRLTIPSVSKHVEQFALSRFAGGNVKMI